MEQKTEEQIAAFNKVPDYNGWTNKPTWLVALWIDNEQSLQQIVAGAASGYFKSDSETAVYNLSDWLKDAFTDELAPDLPASMYADLLTWALAYVDWDSLAQHYIEVIED